MEREITPLIMLIDDNEIDIFINKKFLQVSKITDRIEPFLSAKDALEYLSANVNEPEKLPHIILLDIQMPGINGFEFLDHFDKLHENIQNDVSIIMLSSTIDPVDYKRAKSNKHVVEILKKPLNTEELKSILNDLIKRIAA